MAASASGDVATMARQIEALVERPAWQQDAQIKGDLMKVLGRLTTVRVDVELLKSTGIGKWVKKLTKYDDEVVRGYSSSLTDKWKAQVGVAGGDKPAKSAKETSNGRSSSEEPPAPASNGADRARFENARKNLQDRYAAEKNKRESRTVQMINRPMTTKRRGTTISAAPSRSSLSASRASTVAQRRGLPTAGSRAVVTPPPVRRMLGSNPSRARSAAGSNPADEHRRRQERLRALAQRGLGGGTIDDYVEPSAGPSQNRRLPSPGNAKTASSSRPAPARQPPPQPSDPRKAMLDRMIPRVCGAPAETTKPARKAAGSASTAQGGKAASGSKKKPAAYTEAQRDVIQWLKNLDVDMSIYADAFLDNGFDSIKLLNQIKPRDLESMVPKAGHQRMIETALGELKRKHATAASSRPRSANSRDRDRDLPRRKPRPESFFDEESDDSFVVSDGDEYAPGVITAMFRKGRKRRYSLDSTDSYNMEASYAEIQNEEERSKRIGEYEDYREELRNKNLLKKKK